MRIRELAVADAFELTPTPNIDDRGLFLEWYVADRLQDATGHRFALAQANCSVSNRGVLRGIHFADVPPGQAKYVTCASGAVLDVVVDLRIGSPTFGSWDSVRLDDDERRAVFVAEGLGHAFIALSDAATVLYLCSEPYRPRSEHGVNPFDPGIGIRWPTDIEIAVSPRDEAAPALSDAMAAGLLPSYDACVAAYGQPGDPPTSPVTREQPPA